MIRDAGRAAGLEISPGTLRHTFATNLMRAGVSPVMVARLLGHVRVDLARLYMMPTHGN